MGAVLEGGTAPDASSEPISDAIGTGNSGGIRIRRIDGEIRYIVLYTTLDEPGWPDQFDRPAGNLTYFGDNRSPQQSMLATSGNRALREIFEVGLGDEKRRLQAPPFFLFTKPDPGPFSGWSRRFEGVFVPGQPRMNAEDWLVAKWFETPEGRFENYVLHLTRLPIDPLRRTWIGEVQAGDRADINCPDVYREWLRNGL